MCLVLCFHSCWTASWVHGHETDVPDLAEVSHRHDLLLQLPGVHQDPSLQPMTNATLHGSVDSWNYDTIRLE